MKCPKCQSDNREGVKFCEECGAKMEILCPSCGAFIPIGKKFCGECGQELTIPSESPPKELSFDEKLARIQRYLPEGLTEKILSQRKRIEGERKQVTVMFCDMVGFTALSERIGPEEAYAIMDQVYEILIHKVHDYEGTVNEMTGDGIMALFGAPIAREDAPQRAIRSAYSIHREMTRFSEKMKQENESMPPIKMRIGIHTGPVVVGTLGNDLRVEFKAVGDTVNLASRMEGLADPGATYVSEETFRLTEGFFRFEALGKKEMKGKEEPVPVYRVIAPSTRRTRFDVSAERGLTPLVGRQLERELLLDGFARAKAGRGQAFSIIAEAGVGKSRLLYEFRKSVINENVTFLEGKCLSYSRGVAYQPVVDILKSNFDIRERDGDSEIREKVTKGLKLLGTDELSTLPYLLEVLSVKDSGIEKMPMSLEARKDRIIEALKRIVLKGAEIRLLIMAIEDLHWIDKSSEEFFRDLLDSISGARVLLIFTYRPGFVHTWGGRSYHSQVNLNRLSNRESLAMVAHLFGTEDIDRELEELIIEKTEGVPFFIEEFVKSLKDLRMIGKKNNKYYLVREIQGMAIPSTIQDVVMARVDSLPEGAKELLKTGSVIEREFGYKLIKEVTGLPEPQLLSHLSILKDSELLYERGIYPQSSYIFKHALIQDTAYQSLLKGTRQKYHKKIAWVLEQRFPETAEMQPELLGRHFTEAGLVKQAIPYWQKAGKVAIRRSANVEAIGHLTRGLELLRTLPDTPERMEQKLELLIAMGGPLIATKGCAAQEVEQVYARALELCQQMGETPQLFPALRGLWNYFLQRGKLQRAHELGKQLLSLAWREQIPSLLLGAHRALGTTLYFQGNFAQALEHLEQGTALYAPQQHHSLAFLYGEDPGLVCQLYAAWTLWHLGYPDQALKKVKKALNLAQELSHPHSLAFALNWTASVHQLRREGKAAKERSEAAITISTEQGFSERLIMGTICRGWALAERGQLEEGIAQMRQGIADWQAIRGELALPMHLSMLAEACGKARQVKQGLNSVAEALAEVNETGERSFEGELYRLKGELLRKELPDKRKRAEIETEVEACFLRALEITRHQRAKSFELRATVSLSRLWQQQGKVEKARGILGEICGWFTEGFDTADLKEAKTILEGLA